MLIRGGKISATSACLVDIKKALELQHNYAWFVENTIK